VGEAEQNDGEDEGEFPGEGGSEGGGPEVGGGELGMGDAAEMKESEAGEDEKAERAPAPAVVAFSDGADQAGGEGGIPLGAEGGDEHEAHEKHAADPKGGAEDMDEDGEDVEGVVHGGFGMCEFRVKILLFEMKG